MSTIYRVQLFCFFCAWGVLAHGAGADCNPDETLLKYYIFRACEGGDMAACKELSIFDSQKNTRQEGTAASKLSFKAGRKPPFEFRFEHGDYVKYKGTDGKYKVSKIEGGFRPSSAYSRLIGHSPLRGTEEIRVDETKLQKISEEEFNSIAIDQIFAAMGGVAGTKILYEAGGVTKEAVLEEVEGSVLDSSKENLLVKTREGLQRIPVNSIRSIPLRKASAWGVRASLRVLESYSKLSGLINKVMGPGLGMFLDIMAPTSVACAELLATVFTHLDPSCRQSSQTTISDFFATIPMEDQRKFIRSDNRICSQLQDHISKNTGRFDVIDFSYSDLQCSRNKVSFVSARTLLPSLISPGQFPGYSYKMESSENSKNTTVVVETANNCRNPSVCIQPGFEQKLVAKFIGMQIKEISVNGNTYTEAKDPSLFRTYSRELFELQQKVRQIGLQCIQQKEGKPLPDSKSSK